MDQLAPLTEWGPSLEDVAQEGMGLLPVKGPSSWSDDWLAARYNPTFHLHRGLDIFADFGTPVRATTAGVITRIASTGPGGNSVTMLGGDGATYYFAHLESAADGLEVGHNVELGTLVGFVGNTGNASGGAPHLHFEIRENGEAIPPKPIVDEWLAQAEAAAGDFIEAQRLVLELER
jgi:murein DD-endopeptidase MepM/ murein hydrolase activator NlpD